jgi:hypothetical protein
MSDIKNVIEELNKRLKFVGPDGSLGHTDTDVIRALLARIEALEGALRKARVQIQAQWENFREDDDPERGPLTIAIDEALKGDSNAK